MSENARVICEKCGCSRFEYDSSWKEYCCEACGWLVENDAKKSTLERGRIAGKIEKPMQSAVTPPSPLQATMGETQEPFRQEWTRNKSEVLLEAARPQLFRVNGFRVLDLQVDATPREILRKVEKFEIMDKYGGGGHHKRGTLAIDPPPDANAMREAVQRLHDPERRLVDEFFWFYIAFCHTKIAYFKFFISKKICVFFIYIQGCGDSTYSVTFHVSTTAATSNY